jgi:hypothetical protein
VLTTDPGWLGPLMLAVAVAAVVLICRWVFTPNHPAPRPPAGPADFGLLVPIAVVRTVDDADMLRDLLRDAGIRGTVTDSAEGYAVLVFREDADRARELVRS